MSEQDLIVVNTVPPPVEVANLIVASMARIDIETSLIRSLRKQLKFSCEVHGVECPDPSVRKKKEPVT